MTGPLSPDRYYTSIQAIDLDSLRKAGVTALLVDLDQTLVPRNTSIVPEATRQWAWCVHDAGFKICLFSNNWHQRVNTVASQLGFELVPRAMKPLPFGFHRAMRDLGVTPPETAVVGDQIFTDILGGNLVGATTVLVQPLSHVDLPHTRFLRLIEGWILSDREPDA